MEPLSNRNIGVLGGTFNPVHLGHLILAQDALEKFELEQVLLLPCSTPPHKDSKDLLSADHRLAMLEYAVEGNPWLAVSTIEIDRGGVSYSVDSVRALHEMFPDATLHFIIGADTLTELHAWKNIYDLLRGCEFIIFERPGYECYRVPREDLKLEDPWPEKLLDRIAQGHLVDVSSSEIRMRVAEGMSIRYLVPAAVEMYIVEHGLYT